MDTSALEKTTDPFCFILERREGYMKYALVRDGMVERIWEVHGICTGKGNCWQGANGEKPDIDCPVFNVKNCCDLKTIVIYGN